MLLGEGNREFAMEVTDKTRADVKVSIIEYICGRRA